NNTVTGTNIGAIKEGGEPNHAGNPGGKSVWYTWTSPASPIKTNITTNGTNFNTLLGVYTGSAVNALTPVVSNDDQLIDNGTIQQAEVTFLPAPSTTYFIAVDGFNPGGPVAQGIVRITLR